MVRIGRQRMAKQKETGDSRPSLQTPIAGSANTPSDATNSNPVGKLEEVPVNKAAPRSATGSSALTPTSRPTSSTTIDSQKTAEIKTKLDKTTKTMEQNIQAATQRGESLNELQDKTRMFFLIYSNSFYCYIDVEQVAESSKQFSKNARTVKKNLWWKNMKMTIIITLIVLALLGGIGAVIYFQSK